MDLVLRILRGITAVTELPVTLDFEGAYAEAPDAAAANVRQAIEAGAVGINFEDQVVGGDGLHAIERQATRIAAIREMAAALDVPLVINARTDLFLKAKDPATHPSQMAEAKARGEAYAAAGASCFFVPGLIDDDLIGEICAASVLPVNVMMRPGAPSLARLKQLGVARVSHGPGPYVSLMQALEDAARQACAES